MPRLVLLVEDDEKLGAQVVKQLVAAGLECRWLKDGTLPTAEDVRGIDLVVLDLMLPSLHGLDMLKQLRAFSDVPVLVLSARNDTADKIRSLKLGADDYMTKPFWPEELVERVRARLRRPLLERDGGVRVGPLRIDKERREVFVEQQPIQLTRVEFEILLTLAERPGAAVTRRALSERAFDAEGDASERTLDVHVSRLRKKLGDTSLVETVWGIGYRLASDIEA